MVGDEGASGQGLGRLEGDGSRFVQVQAVDGSDIAKIKQGAELRRDTGIAMQVRERRHERGARQDARQADADTSACDIDQVFPNHDARVRSIPFLQQLRDSKLPDLRVDFLRIG